MPSLQAGIFGSRLRRRGLPFLRADQLQGRQHRAPPEAAGRETEAAAASRTTAPDVRCRGRERGASLTPLPNPSLTRRVYTLLEACKKLSFAIVYATTSCGLSALLVLSFP